MKMKKILSNIAAASLTVFAISATASAWIDPNPDIWDTENIITNDILAENGVDESKFAEGATVTVDFKIATDPANVTEEVVKTNIWDGADNHTFIYYHESASPDKFDDRVVIGDDETEFNNSVTVTVGDALEIRYAGNNGFSLTSITLKDGEGNVFATYADGAITVPTVNEGASDDANNDDASNDNSSNDNAAADDTSSDNTNTNTGNNESDADNKNQPNTGVAGVAIIIGVAVLASGAVIVAKKRM